MNEAALRTKIVKALNAEGGFFWVNHQTMYGQVGVADIVGVYKGRLVAIEVKRPGRLSTLTARQRIFLEHVKMNSGRAGVATSVDEALAIMHKKAS